jgi:hypothetical protein
LRSANPRIEEDEAQDIALGLIADIDHPAYFARWRSNASSPRSSDPDIHL